MTAPYDIDNTSLTLPARNADANKGDFGNALLVGGSKGMAGAIILATKACLRGGVGKVYALATDKVCDCLQIATPEAICVYVGKDLTDDANATLLHHDLSAYTSVAIGPGLGLTDDTRHALPLLLRRLRQKDTPTRVILDADALNILAQHSDWPTLIPPQCVLTPHPKEWQRLSGVNASQRELQIEKARELALQNGFTVVLKGHETFIAFADGSAAINHTGNHGMAKGGSGDVLTGLLASLLAQPIDFQTAVCAAVYLHGRAGDYAMENLHPRAMTASDIIDHFSDAFSEIDPS